MMGTWIVGAVVLIVVGLAGYHVYKGRRRGMGCGSGCEGCSGCPGRAVNGHDEGGSRG